MGIHLKLVDHCLLLKVLLQAPQADIVVSRAALTWESALAHVSTHSSSANRLEESSVYTVTFAI